jgi:hypothetical protein
MNEKQAEVPDYKWSYWFKELKEVQVDLTPKSSESGRVEPDDARDFHEVSAVHG